MDNKKVEKMTDNFQLSNNSTKNYDTNTLKSKDKDLDKTLKKINKYKVNNSSISKSHKIDVFEDTMWWCE